MKLYFLRHAPALSREEWDASDDLRPLSVEGAALARNVALRIASMDLGLVAIITSPYKRALGTALPVSEALGAGATLIEDRGLEPGMFTRSSLAGMLARYAAAPALMVVGHEPCMTGVISDVIGGGRLNMKKGGLARVDIDPVTLQDGVLRFFVPPGLLVHWEISPS